MNRISRNTLNKNLIFILTLILAFITIYAFTPNSYAEETKMIIHTNPSVSDYGNFLTTDASGIPIGVIIEGKLQDKGRITLITKGIFKNSSFEVSREESYRITSGNPKHVFNLDYPFKYDSVYSFTVKNGVYSKTVKGVPLTSSLDKQSKQIEVFENKIPISFNAPANSLNLYNYTDKVRSFIVFFQKDPSGNSGILTFKGKYLMLPSKEDYDTIPAYSDPLRYNIPIKIYHDYDYETFNVGVTQNGNFDFTKKLTDMSGKPFEIKIFSESRWEKGLTPFIISKTLTKSSEKVQPKKAESNPAFKTPKCIGISLCLTDKVITIIDGDTIYVKNYKIRLSLTDTPEKNQAGFSEATSFTKKLCPVGSIIIIDQDDKQKIDAYGRIVAKVTCSDKNLNAELLENGHAVILKQYCSKSEFSSESWAVKFGCKV